jgi:methyltransferase family protein
VAGDWSYRVKAAYVRGARAAGRALTGLGILPHTPPDRRDRLRHWLTSLTRVHDSLAIAELDVPWWTYGAIDVVDAWLRARRRPIRVFEFGSGASTLWLARRADEVHTVEHHAEFAARMGPVFAAYRGIRLHRVEAPASARPRVPSGKAGHQGLDFADYVATIDRVGGRFDLVVVDGRAREACLRASLPHLAADGLVVFDNSGRRRYRRAIAESGLLERRFAGLTPTLPYPEQTSLLAFPGARAS